MRFKRRGKSRGFRSKRGSFRRKPRIMSRRKSRRLPSYGSSRTGVRL